MSTPTSLSKHWRMGQRNSSHDNEHRTGSQTCLPSGGLLLSDRSPDRTEFNRHGTASNIFTFDA
ncbi:MAG: hypothetical protein AAGJ83_15420, partial [Planctomycetota bacterium]